MIFIIVNFLKKKIFFDVFADTDIYFAKIGNNKKKIDKTLQNVSISLTQQEENLSTVIDTRWQHFPLIY